MAHVKPFVKLPVAKQSSRCWGLPWLHFTNSTDPLVHIEPLYFTVFFLAKEWIGPAFRYMLKMKFWNWLKRIQETLIFMKKKTFASSWPTSFKQSIQGTPQFHRSISSWQVARGAKGAVRGWTSKFGWCFQISLFGKANKQLQLGVDKSPTRMVMIGDGKHGIGFTTWIYMDIM